MSDIIGTASILITAEGKDFPKSLEKLSGTLTKSASKAGINAGTAMSKGVQASATKQIAQVSAKAGQAIQKGIVPAAEKASQKTQSAFGKGMSKLVGIANKSASQTGEQLKSKIPTAATAAVNKVQSIFKGISAKIGSIGKSAADKFRASLEAGTGLAAKIASTKVGGILISGMAKAGQMASAALNSKFSQAVLKGISTAANKAKELFVKGFQLAKHAAAEAGRAALAVGKRLASGLASAASAAGKTAGKAMGTALKVSGLAAVGAVAAGAGKMLTGGFGRLTSLDTATKKLQGLNITGKKLEKVMDNASASVDGTAFSLDAATTVAASFVAAGLEPGKKLEGSLKNVASAAAIAGVNMQDIAPIFTDAAAAGKVTGDTLMRLEMQGIGASKMMADELGISTDDLRKKVSKGEVSFDQFSKVIGSQLGEAATIAGTSFKGMAANIGNAMNRVGAVALTPVFEGLKKVMPSVIDLFKRMQTAIQPFVDKVAPKVKEFFKWLKGILDSITFGKAEKGADSLVDTFLGLQEKVQGVIMKMLEKLPALLGELLPKMAEFIIGKITFLVQAVAVIIAAVAQALVDGLPIIIESFVNLIPGLVDTIVGMIPNLVAAFVGIIGAITDLMVTMLPLLISAAIRLFSGLLEGLVESLPQILSGLIELVMSIASTLITMAPMLIDAAIDLFAGLVEGLIQVLPQLVNGLVDLITQMSTTLITQLPLLIQAAITLFSALLQGIIQNLPVIIAALLTLVTTIATALLENLPLLLQAAIDLFLGIVQGIIAVLPTIIETLMTLLPKIIQAIVDMLPVLLDGAIRLFSMLIDAVVENLPLIIEMIGTLLPMLIDALMEMLPELLDGAITLFNAIIEALPVILPLLIDGIMGMLPDIILAVINMIPDLIEGAIQLFNALIEAIPVILPLLLDSITKMLPDIVAAIIDMVPDLLEAGKDIIRGLIDGIKSMASTLITSIKETVTDALPSFVKKALGIQSPSKVFKGFGHNIILGLTAGLKASAKRADTAINRIVAKIKDTPGLKGKSAMVTYVESQGKELLKLYAQQKALVAKVKDETEKLADLRAEKADAAAETKGNLKGEFDLGSFIKTSSRTGKMSATFADISSGVKAIATRMKKFAAKIKKLLKKGYPNAIVQEVVNLGSEQGIIVADALLSATDAERGSFIKSLGSLDTAAGTVGNTLAADMYNAGIETQKGLVAGLLAKKENLDKAAKSLADTLTTYVKKHLGIKSPSKVFEGLGEYMGAGMVKGLKNMEAPVGKAVKDMTNVKVNGMTPTNVGGVRIPSTPMANAPAVAGPVAAGGDTYQVSVTVTMDNISQLKDLEEFLKMVRVKARMGVGTSRIGG